MTTRLFILFFIFISTAVFADSNWNNYIQGLRTEAIAKGIRPEIFDEAFQGIQEPHKEVLRFDRTQPEKRITYFQYRNSRASKDRIVMGRREIKKHRELLDKIANHYHVDACYIGSLWGLETSYGHYMGKFSVIQSLATLAYDQRRAAIFRKELFYALEMLNEGHVALKDLKGEWAGATGQPQFLPSTWHNYAVDFDGDGKKDIWKSDGDIFASIANYLHVLGWQENQLWTVQVDLPTNFDRALLTTKTIKTVADWEKMGVHFAQPENISADLAASVIQPDGAPAMMVFNNFRVIMKWNRSSYYAGTVGYMAEEICR
ncbi:MAG TPA: lytic murein transglycosylase [Coxiellaceae bacterium]|nr:MAG: lytic transglycosylase [Gammaproteobacteria bacterium RIFCSPHIGHO2_12_FULL_36_30]HLB56525.1 lytic murein transglycosylase [Coxiellaceae bacterium]